MKPETCRQLPHASFSVEKSVETQLAGTVVEGETASEAVEKRGDWHSCRRARLQRLRKNFGLGWRSASSADLKVSFNAARSAVP